MRIAIDASRCTVPRVTGTENYAIQLIKALIRLNTKHQITLYFRDQPRADLFPASSLVEQRIIPYQRVWTHFRFAAALWHDKPDVTFVPAHTLPFIFPGRAVATIHDLGFKYFPQAHPTSQRIYLDWTTRYSAHRANVILADSQATADDLHKYYGTPPAKIHVVYPGVDKPKVADIEAIRRKYNLPRRYFLFLGTLQPRKNIARLIQAFALWRTQHPSDSTDLVLAGGQGWLYDWAWKANVEGIHLTGYIDDGDKGALYANAVALVFPSLYEGFGFPVLEAMHSGTPVIASSTSSLPELVGDAGLLVDPLSIESIAAAMTHLSHDEYLRQYYCQLGYQQVKKFTWEKAAEQLIAVFESL